MTQATPLWIVHYSHRHGDDIWPRFQAEAPSKEDAIADIEAGGAEFLGEDHDEWIDIRGPYDLPAPQAAAPELLAALEAFVAGGVCEECEELQMARAAIAKAKGQ